MNRNTGDIASPSGDAAERDVANAHKPFPKGRVAAWVVTLAIAAYFAWSVANNENFGWHVVGQYLFDPVVINGLYVSLGLTVVAMAFGIVLGLLLAVARLSKDTLASTLASLFIWFFRGTPLLVQLIFWYNLSTLFPTISIGIPFGPTFVSWDTNSVISPMTAAIAGLALNEAAYMAEIIRGGLLSVERGQFETAEAFGMTRARATPHHHPAGHALHRTAHGQPAHQHDQGDLARQRHRHGRSALFRAVDLQPHLRGRPDAAGRGHLVSADHIGSEHWPELYRALL